MADSNPPQNSPVYPQVFKSDPKKSKIDLPNSLSKVRIMFGVIGFFVMAVGVGLAVNLSQQQQTASSRASENAQQSTTGRGSSVNLDPRLSVSHHAGLYNDLGENYFVQGAENAQNVLGFKSIEIAMLPGLCESSAREPKGMYGTHQGWCPTSNLKRLAEDSKYQQVFNMPFKTYMIVANSLDVDNSIQEWDIRAHQNGLDQNQLSRTKTEFKDLAKYLLTTYKNTNKTFIIESVNEMDWQVSDKVGDAELDPRDQSLQNAINYWNTVQDAIDEAKREVGVSGIKLYHGCEVNLVTKSSQRNKKSVTRDVLPQTRCDLYGYSAYDGYDGSVFTKNLDYIQSKAPNRNPDFQGKKNVWISEWGMPENLGRNSGASDKQMIEISERVIDQALAWGVPYFNYWQLYDNECTQSSPQENQCNGFWLLKPGTVKTLIASSVYGKDKYHIPADPTNFRAQCSSDGRSAILTWDGQGAEKFNVRVTDGVNDQKNPASNCPGNPNLATCINDVTQTNLTVPVVPGRNNSWWMEAGKNGKYTDSVGGPNFTCNADGSGGASPTPGISSNPGSIIQNIISLFGGSGNPSQGDQNNDGRINELDFGAVYSR